MAKAWITDLWVKDAIALMPNGDKVRISPTAAELKNIRSLPEHFRTARYGAGKRWRVGWYEPGGERRSRHFDLKSDAERYLAELDDTLRSGRYAPPELAEQPFGKLSQTWLASKRRTKERTVGRYESELAVHILPQWEHIPINQITRQKIDAWVTELIAGTAPREYTGKGRGRKKEPLAPRTVRHVVGRTFGGAIRYAVDEGWIPRDPLRRVELPRPTPSEHLSVLTHQEVDSLATAMTRVIDKRGKPTGSQRDRALVYLLAASGPRINEALALQVQDIRVGDRRADIRRTWTKDRAGKRVLGPPKTWEKRSIPLPDYVIDELRPLMKGRKPTDWLFRGDRTDSALDHKNWYNRLWTPALEHAGLDDDELGLTIHKLRHTAASAAIAAGADVKVVQTMLGHKNASETLDTYSHLWPDRLDEVIVKVTEHRAAALRLAA